MWKVFETRRETLKIGRNYSKLHGSVRNRLFLSCLEGKKKSQFLLSRLLMDQMRQNTSYILLPNRSQRLILWHLPGQSQSTLVLDVQGRPQISGRAPSTSLSNIWIPPAAVQQRPGCTFVKSVVAECSHLHVRGLCYPRTCLIVFPRAATGSEVSPV